MQSENNLPHQNLCYAAFSLHNIHSVGERTDKKSKQTCWQINHLYKKILLCTVKAFRPKSNVQCSCPWILWCRSWEWQAEGRGAAWNFIFNTAGDQRCGTLLISCFCNVCRTTTGAIQLFANWLWPLILWFLSSLWCAGLLTDRLCFAGTCRIRDSDRSSHTSWF